MNDIMPSAVAYNILQMGRKLTNFLFLLSIVFRKLQTPKANSESKLNHNIYKTLLLPAFARAEKDANSLASFRPILHSPSSDRLNTGHHRHPQHVGQEDITSLLHAESFDLL
jgi:hypothetical protein